jgi:hypothetical protein
MARVQRPSDLIKTGGKRKHFLRKTPLIMVENVSWEQIFIINQNHYRILRYNTKFTEVENKTIFVLLE